ncbi:MAG: carboxypeptidase-like regulatory domain-containing protein, partial [Planctomycetota bacterium]
MTWSFWLLTALGWLPGGDGALRVRVLDVSGRPLPAVEPQSVRFASKQSGHLSWSWAEIDVGHPGAFLVRRGPLDLEGMVVVESSDERVGLAAVQANTTELDVRLREPLCFELEFRDDRGATVERAYANYIPVLLGVDASGSLGNCRGFRHHVPVWRVPDAPFRIEVDAGPLFLPFTRTFESNAEVTSPLVLALPRYPRLAGIVRSGGGPAPDVTVQLWRASPPARDPRAELDGHARPRPAPEYSTISDAEGRFVLPLRAAGDHVVRALSAWLGGQAERLVTLREGESRTDVSLDLELGVAPLEGRVRLPSRCQEPELYLRGTTNVSVPLSADGHFRIENCLAGDCELRLSTQRTAGSERALDGLDFGLVHALHIAIGKTTTVELDLTRPPPCRLSGSLAADGVPLVPLLAGGGDFPVWRQGSSQLESWRRAPGSAVLSEGAIADNGTFRLGALAPVEVLLSVDIAALDGVRWTVLDRLELARPIHQSSAATAQSSAS